MVARRLAALLALALCVQSCGGSPSPPPTSPTGPTVTAVVVSGWLQPLAIGERVQLTATAIYTDGASRTVNTEAVWESSNPLIATVVSGSVTGVALGTAAIIARFGGKDGNQGITVQASSTPNPTPSPGPTPPLPPNPGLACGVERWFVKTLADTDASTVNLTVVTPLSIRDLNGLPSHCEAGADRRIYAEEFRVFEIVGRVIYVAHEDDRDYHIAIEDMSSPGSTVVTELADTLCAGAVMSPHLAALRSVEGKFATVLNGRSPSTLVGSMLKVRGVGFYDFDHGQRGRSRNCIELHPITDIERQ